MFSRGMSFLFRRHLPAMSGGLNLSGRATIKLGNELHFELYGHYKNVRQIGSYTNINTGMEYGQ